MSELASLFAQYGLPFFIHSTQTLLALLAADGRLLEGNPALESLRASQPTDNLPAWLTPASQTLLLEKMKSGEVCQPRLSLLTDPENGYAAWLIPLPGELFLLCLEPDWKAHRAELAQFKQQLATVQQKLELKKIDLESVLVQASEVSHTDPLTFLPNRRKIVADLQREVEASQNSLKPLTIFMLDIDHFKQVNDTYGHSAGDMVLRALAGKLQAGARQTDKLGRYGGEEFLVLLPATPLPAAINMAQRLLNLAHELKIPLEAGQNTQVTISVGIAQYQIGQESWDELLERADQAMYQSKHAGRDRWSISHFGNGKNV